MRIAYILPYLQKPSGWRSHAAAFLQAINRFVEPILFVAETDAAVARSLFSGLPICTLPVTQQTSLSSPRGVRVLIACYWEIRQGHFPAVDLVHSLEAYPTGLVGSWLAQKLDCPHAITSHGTYGIVWYERKIDRIAYEQVLRKTQLVCPVSYGTARLMQQYFGQALAGARLQPILNGNDYYKAVSRTETNDRPLPTIPTLLTVGDVKPRKGLHTSLAAYARVKQRLPDTRYWIAGHFKDNEYYLRQKEWIARHQVKGVSFLGRVSDANLRRCYQESSVFVMTPQQEGLQFEGFGLVYLEAGAYGLPVVGTRTGGVTDAVRDGETGFLVEPGDAEGAAREILRLLTQPELARQMGRANREWSETLTWDRCAQEQFEAYQELFAS